MVKHGTVTRYMQGCRCDSCTAANSARAYAQRVAKKWDEPILERVVVSESMTPGGGRVVVPACVVAQAIAGLGRRIKMEALTIQWLKRKQRRMGV